MDRNPVHATDALLAALAEGSQALHTASHWSEGVEQLLAAIGKATGVSRVWVFQLLELQEDAIIQDYIFEWSADLRYRQLYHKRFRFFRNWLDDPTYRTLITERYRGVRHSILVSDLPATSTLRADLENQNILSMATVPIVVDGQVWGTLGIDDCERAMSWQGAGLDLLSAAAGLFAATIYHHELQSRSRQIELFHKVANCGAWEINLDNGLLWCSQSLFLKMGYPAVYPRIAIRRLLAHIEPADRQLLWASLRQHVAQQRIAWRQDIRFRNAYGTCWHEIVAEISYSANGQPQSLSGLIIDISERKGKEEQALSASEQDALTGILNRRGLSRHLQDTLHNRPECPNYVLLLDIDHFKHINDNYGHQAGDAVLLLFTNRITQALRPGDIFARSGGEEFTLFAQGLNATEILQFAERLRSRIANDCFVINLPNTTAPLHLQVTISIGIAALPDGAAHDHAEREAIAIAHADEALYTAKRTGRNRSVLHDESHSS